MAQVMINYFQLILMFQFIRGTCIFFTAQTMNVSKFFSVNVTKFAAQFTKEILNGKFYFCTVLGAYVFNWVNIIQV